jgi:hypothetical protein
MRAAESSQPRSVLRETALMHWWRARRREARL